MKKILALAMTAGIALATTGIAEARQGCGPGYHRGPHGRCLANARHGVGVAVTPGGRLVVGRFYHGRGYWNGRRYYQHRARRGPGWHYW
ncbi:MAG: hypothetical protein QM676_07260 [Novosphingobium sp.]